MAVSPLEEALSVLDRGEEAHKRLDIVTAMDYYKRFKTLMVKVFYSLQPALLTFLSSFVPFQNPTPRVGFSNFHNYSPRAC